MKARNSGQLGKVCLQARVEGEDIVRQQIMWRASNPEAVEAYTQLLAAAVAKRAEAGIGNVDVKPGSQGSDSQEAIDQIVAAARTEEDKKSMAALASTASADGTIGVKVMGQASFFRSNVLSHLHFQFRLHRLLCFPWVVFR